eukprot:3235443-Prymnesium_polylepis.1
MCAVCVSHPLVTQPSNAREARARHASLHTGYEAHARRLDAPHHAAIQDPDAQPLLTRLRGYPPSIGLVVGAFSRGGDQGLCFNVGTPLERPALTPLSAHC